MPKGELFINNKDSYDNWGISMDTSSLSALMTPPPNKEFIENKSRLEHGKRVIAATPKVDERSLTLTINLTAKNEDEFFEKYDSFCQELYNPQIQISAESETKRSIFREKDKTKRSKKESAQHSKSRNKSFVMTSVSAL